jgi:hypothetical protein
MKEHFINPELFPQPHGASNQHHVGITQYSKKHQTFNLTKLKFFFFVKFKLKNPIDWHFHKSQYETGDTQYLMHKVRD